MSVDFRILQRSASAGLFPSARATILGCALGAAWVWAGCAAPPLPLDELLGAGQARAGKVTRDSELIGGPVAYARSGDVYKLYNSQVRFLVQDAGTSVGLDLYGGNLIDADLVRPGDDGRNGNDLFRETFPIVGLRVPQPTAIEVVADGTKGGAAHLRVRATDGPAGILPQLDAIAHELGGEITTDYVLEPDVPYLRITTTYRAPPDQRLDSLILGDFLSFGASLSILSPENGFTGDASEVSFIASAGRGTSYGYVFPDGNLQLPLVDASGTVTMLKNVPLAPGDSVDVTRYLVVGGGDPASVARAMYGLRGLRTVQLSGVVRDGDGAPVRSGHVTLFRAPYGPASNAVSQADIGPDGGYALHVPPGDYVAVTGAIGRLRGAPQAVALADAARVDLTLGAAGFATLDIAEAGPDGTRVPVPAKVSFLGLDVEAPDPRFGDDPTEREHNGVHAVAMTPDGRGRVAVKPGRYDVVVSRGPEYEIERLRGIVVPADRGGRGDAVAIRADLRHVVDTAGFISGDYHQHTQGSIDSPVPLRDRVIENMAEGVEFPASTDHDNITDYRPHIAALGAGAFIGAMPGDEISVNGLGHFNAYPMSVDAQNPYAKVGAKLWAGLSIPAMVDRVRRGEPGDVIVHISHPRSKSIMGYFNSVHFDPTTGESDEPIDAFDAIEVNGELGRPEDHLADNDATVHRRAMQGAPSGIPTLRDFFGLLNRGRRVCALGNSDSHGRNDSLGYPRNYLLVGPGRDDPARVAAADVVAAIRGGRVIVSSGPFVTVSIDGRMAFGRDQAISVTDPTRLALTVRVQAPSWVPVSTIEVYENGRPLPLRRAGMGALEAVAPGTAGASYAAAILPDEGGGAQRFSGTVRVAPTRDAYYVVVVRGAGSLLPVAGGASYAYTNPIYVDVGGDGWTPPSP